MRATYPEYRNRSVGPRLMARGAAGCTLSSIEVFEGNAGALWRYHRLGYEVIVRRPVIPHACHPCSDGILLLTRALA